MLDQHSLGAIDRGDRPVMGWCVSLRSGAGGGSTVPKYCPGRLVVPQSSVLVFAQVSLLR